MSILAAILLFSLLIFIHELGHFVAAKLSGVQVNEFSLFMGPAIVKWQKGETLYAIRCIPLGGYCAMEGEDKDSENPRSFPMAAWWKRLIILVSGVFMNFVVGLALMCIICAPAKTVGVPVISEAMTGCTIVREDALHVGDRFVEVDGEKTSTLQDFSLILTVNPGDVHDIVVERDGALVEFNDFYMEKHMFQGEEEPMYGIRFESEELDFAGKIRYAWLSCVHFVRNARLSLQMLLAGKLGLRDMSGPANLVKLMSDAASSADTTLDGLYNLLYIGAFISINLAVMNLLPIPAIDGGRVVGLLLTTAIEAITHKKINPKYEGYIHGVGMFILFGLLLVVTFKDFFVMFKG